MDREQLDLAILHATVADFVKRVAFLFKQGGRMTVESSFTQHCLTLLSTGQLQVLEQGTRESEQSGSAQVHLEDVHLGRHGKGGGGGRVPRLLGCHWFICFCFGR